MRKRVYLATIAQMQRLQINENREFIVVSVADLDSNKSAIKHFDTWNNNLKLAETFDTPAIFIEFAPIEWQHLSGGVREALVQLVLHVISPQNDVFDYLFFLDLLDGLNKCLHGFRGQDFNPFTSVSSKIETETDQNVFHGIETYSCHIIDRSAQPLVSTISNCEVSITTS